jgi:ABC-2 type transport system permease protein
MPGNQGKDGSGGGMFASIVRFEFRYQLRNPVFWVAFAMFFLFAFGTIASDNIQIGDGGNVHANAPRAIVLTHLVMAILFMFALAAMVANVVIRDDETRFGPLIRTTRITKTAYLLGRFAGAWGAAALCYASVPLALWIGSMMPWIDPATLGPNRLSTYLFAYGVMGLPVLLVTGAVLFSVATATRSMMATYLAIVVFFAGYAAITALIGTVPTLRPYAPYLEPFGIAAFSLETRYWTAADSNTLLPSLVGPIGSSRLLWIGIAGVLLGLAQWRYRFADRGVSRRAARRQARADAIEAQAAPAPVAAGALPRPSVGAWRCCSVSWWRFRRCGSESGSTAHRSCR